MEENKNLPANIEPAQLATIARLGRQIEKYTEYTEILTNKIINLETNDEYNSKLPELRQDLAAAKITTENVKMVLDMANKFTRATFLTAANPVKMLNVYSKVTTPKKALAARKITLIGIEKALGEGTAIDWLKVLVYDLTNRVGVDQNLDNLEFVATEIYEANKTLTTPEVILVFRRVATGYYGELYNKANALNICPIFKQYQSERIKAIQEIEREKNTGKSMAGSLLHVAKVMEAAPKTSLLHELSRKSKDKKLFKAPHPEKESLEIEALKSESNELLSMLRSSKPSERDELEYKYLQVGDELGRLREIVQLKNALTQTKVHLERDDLTDLKRVEFEESISRVMDRLMELET